MPWEMGFVCGKLHDVGLKPVTFADITTKLLKLTSASPQAKYDELKINEIPTLAQELTLLILCI